MILSGAFYPDLKIGVWRRRTYQNKLGPVPKVCVPFYFGGDGGADIIGADLLNQFSVVPNFVRRTAPQPRRLMTEEKRNPKIGMNPIKLTSRSPSNAPPRGETAGRWSDRDRLSPKK